MSQLEVDKVIPQSGTTLTIGDSGDTITIASGATLSGDLNASNLTSGTVPDARITGAYTGITNLTMSGDLTVGNNKSLFILDSGGDKSVQITNDNSSTNSLQIDADPDNSASGSYTAFRIDNSEKARIDASGNFGIGVSSPSRKLQIVQDSTSAGGIYLYSNAVHTGTDTNALLAVRSDSNNGSNNGDVVNIQGDGVGDLLVLNNNGTDRLQIKADGTIGTGSSSGTLVIQGGSTYPGAKIQMAGGQASSNPGTIIFSTDDGNVSNVSERARIDDDGNFLVGKSALEYGSTAGIILRNDGLISCIRSGGNVTDFNRTSSAGEVVRISYDGDTVGSLETVGVSTSGRLIVKSTTFDGFLDRAGTTIAKWMQSSFTPGADNTFDLGRSASERWKDIYLSGGAFLGGTGTANKLDDYETGTWTPTLSTAVSSITVSGYTSQIGNYVKVGRLVTLTCMIQATVTAFSNDPTIIGLPFAPANNRYTGVALGLSNLILSDDADNVSNGQRLAPSVRTTDIRFYNGGYNTSSADAYICFTTQYETNA